MTWIAFGSPLARPMLMSAAYAIAADLVVDAIQGAEKGTVNALDVLRAATLALRSYQHGNEAAALACRVAGMCDLVSLSVGSQRLGSPEDAVITVLKGASHALRSYQFGNAAPALARAIACACDAAIARAEIST